MDLSLPYLGHEGDLKVSINPGKGDPWGEIHLTEDCRISLRWLSEGDCDQLIKAAADVKQQITDARARAAQPHKAWMATDRSDSCLHCGKPEADELHAEPEPEPEPEDCGFTWRGEDGLMHGCVRPPHAAEYGHEVFTADGTRLTHPAEPVAASVTHPDACRQHGGPDANRPGASCPECSRTSAEHRADNAMGETAQAAS